MGIVCAYHAAADGTLERIAQDPPLVWLLIAREDPAVYLEHVNASRRVGFLGRLLGRRPAAPVTDVPDLRLDAAEMREGDIDKAWHGIHYCLNQTAAEAPPPLDFLTAGGEELGSIDVGYGPARGMRSAEVRRLDELLAAIDMPTLRERYEPARMAALDIYPDIWERDGEAGFEYLAEHYTELREFIHHCADHRLGMVIYYS